MSSLQSSHGSPVFSREEGRSSDSGVRSLLALLRSQLKAIPVRTTSMTIVASLSIFQHIKNRVSGGNRSVCSFARGAMRASAAERARRRSRASRRCLRNRRAMSAATWSRRSSSVG